MPWGTAAPSAPVTTDPNVLKKILDMIGSTGGQTLVGAAGAGMSAYGAGKQADASRAQNASQFAASTAQRQLENDQGMQLQRAQAGAAADPLGAQQGYAQKQAISKAILGGARNYSVAPGDPAVAAAMGKSTGGLTLPTGGFDPAMLERLFGDEATQAAMAARQKSVGQINPNAPVHDLGTMFGNSADGSQNAFTTDVLNANHQALNSQMDESARQRSIIQRAIDQDISGEKQTQDKKGSSIWKKLAKVGMLVGGAAATPFLGPAGIALMGAGMGMGNAALDGAGVKGSLLGGALGAATAGIGGGAAGSAVKSGLGQVVKSTLKNPALYSTIGGR